MRIGWVALLGLALTGTAGAADFSNFYDYLKSFGMKTDYLESLCRNLDVRFDLDENDHPGKFAPTMGYLQLQKSLLEPHTTDAIARELTDSQRRTLIHELVHAEYHHKLGGGKFTKPDSSWAAGTPQKAHYDAWFIYREDLFGQDGQWLTKLKAEEICGFTVEGNFNEVFEVADILVKYNTDPAYFPDIAAKFGPVVKLGHELVLPDGSPDYPQPASHKRVVRTFEFGNRKVPSYFNDKPLPYTDKAIERKALFADGLGLKPPPTTGDLIDRMNRAKTLWMDLVRSRVYEARLKSVGQVVPRQWVASPVDNLKFGTGR
jgi:hypothetical protein